jgi:phage FluMu protein Com
MASVTCTHCGAMLKTKDPVAPGKKLKCPKCAKVFAVPADEEEPVQEEAAAEEESEEEEEAPKAKKPTKAADDEEDEGDEEEESPKSKKPARDDDEDNEDDAPKSKKPSKDDDDEEDDAPKAKKKPAKAEDDEDEEDDRSKKKSNKDKGKFRKGDPDEKPKSGSKLPLILGIGGGVLLLCCVAPCGFLAIFPPELKDGQWGAKDVGKPQGIAFTITAEQISKEFIDNEAACKKKYDNKKVEVTGEVSQFTRRGYFLLKGVEQAPGKRVDPSVGTASDDKEWTIRIAKGQKVKLISTVFFRQAGMIELTLSKLLDPSQPTLIEMSADAFVKELDANQAVAEAKYKGKDVLLSGVIDKVDNFSVHLKSPSKRTINFGLDGGDEKSKDVKVGQQVELRGEVSIIGEGGVVLIRGAVVSAK